jgi:hypothetical protein
MSPPQALHTHLRSGDARENGLQLDTRATLLLATLAALCFVQVVQNAVAELQCRERDTSTSHTR